VGESYVAVSSWNEGIVAAWPSADACEDDIVVGGIPPSWSRGSRRFAVEHSLGSLALDLVLRRVCTIHDVKRRRL
jgi:hypothetical protein